MSACKVAVTDASGWPTAHCTADDCVWEHQFDLTSDVTIDELDEVAAAHLAAGRVPPPPPPRPLAVEHVSEFVGRMSSADAALAQAELDHGGTA